MGLTTAGVNYISQMVLGQGTPFNAANAHLAVGNSSAAFAASQTDLQGTDKVRKGMNAGFPRVSPPSLIFEATFGQNEANFEWNEWAVMNAVAGGVMLNRAVEAIGTKQSNQTWVLNVEITFAIGN